MTRAMLVLLGCLTASCGGPEPAAPPAETAAPDTGAGTILRVDPRFDALVPAEARIEKLADGFVFTEGPVWDRAQSRLLFSDVRGNGVYQWTESGGTSPVIEPVFEGDRTGLRSVSSNGLTLDARAASSCASTATDSSRAWRRTVPGPPWSTATRGTG